MTNPPADTDAQTHSIGRLAELIAGDPMAGMDADMKAVTEMLAQLGARPLEQLTPAAGRAARCGGRADGARRYGARR